MNMEVINTVLKLCSSCMEYHDVQIVRLVETGSFKNTPVNYEANYHYCANTDELYMDEAQIQENDIALKNAYRKNQGLLTTSELMDIRKMYGISQKDLCILLGWGAKTITRYETHQVQDKAHNSILKKISQDPEWFITLLEDAKEQLSKNAYKKYSENAQKLCIAKQNTKLDETLKNARKEGAAQKQEEMIRAFQDVLSSEVIAEKMQVSKEYILDVLKNDGHIIASEPIHPYGKYENDIHTI